MEPAPLKQAGLVAVLEVERVLGRLETLHLQFHHKETMAGLVRLLDKTLEAVVGVLVPLVVILLTPLLVVLVALVLPHQ
jgi:hypothetical protein